MNNRIPTPPESNWMPECFLWGVATSAFQIEGFLENDMTDWERQGKFNQGPKNPHYDHASQHWKFWESDLKLLTKLKVNAYRFSMDWGRLQPEPRSFNEKALQRYETMIDKLLELKITPMLTLHHFTHPIWFHQHSPWIHKDSIDTFSYFTETIIKRFHNKIPYFITFNEPVVWALAAYGDGKFPPGEKKLLHVASALKHMLIAHEKAYQIIKSYNPKIQVGIAHNFIIFKPERAWNLLDQGLTALIHRFYNLSLPQAFLSNQLKMYFPLIINFQTEIPLDNQIDFWGINYYYRMHLRFQIHWDRPFLMNFHNRSGNGLSDLGWEIYPDGLYQIMRWLQVTRKPFLITENGIADRTDRQRRQFIQSHVAVVKKGLQQGLPIKGYFYWSLMDNYEWLVGLDARFGLYEVDYTNHCQRKLRPSGEYFSALIAQE